MTISALGELIRTKKRDEISKIVSFLSGNFLYQVVIRELRMTFQSQSEISGPDVCPVIYKLNI